MVGIFPTEAKLFAQRYEIEEAANFGSKPEQAVALLMQKFGYGRYDAIVILNRFRTKPDTTP